MSDIIAGKYNLTFKDGLYYKADGSPWAKSNGCNLAKGKLRGDGYKVTVVPVQGGHALRVVPLTNTEQLNSTANRPTERVALGEQPAEQQKPAEGKEMSLEDLRKQVAELEERRQLESKLAALRGEQPQSNTQEPARGNAPSGRPKRKKFDRDLLDFPEKPGYVGRIVNDVPGSSRIQDFIDNGWVVDETCNVKTGVDGDVNRPSQLGRATARPVGTDPQGKPLNGVLMYKKKEWYDEDQDDKRREREAMMAQLNAPPKGSGLHTLANQRSALQAVGFEAEADKSI